jgi:tetratricopeptide (TPR) repeat protein
MQPRKINDLIGAEREAERHRKFTNRETELSLLEQLTHSITDPARIVGFRGAGGVGKSELLIEFISYADKNGYPYIFIDGYSEKGIVSVLNKLRNLAGKFATQDQFTEFDRYFYLYLRMQKKVLRDDDLIASFKKAIIRARSDEGHTSVSLNFSEQDSAMALLKDTYDAKEVEFYLQAEDYLTNELTNSLEKISTSQPWLLIIDAYENLVELDYWMRDNLIRNLPEYFRVVIAGRKPYKKEWHELRPVFKSVNLMAFGEQHTKEYLSRCGINENDLINEVVYRQTNGHPLFLAMAAELKEKNPAMSMQDFFSEDKFIGLPSIWKSVRDDIKDADLLEAIEVCSTVRFFDEELLVFFLGPKAKRLLEILVVDYSSFVHQRGQRYALHDLFWEYSNSEQKIKDEKKYIELNRRAIDYLGNKIETTNKDNWQKYIIEILYHRLATDWRDGLYFLTDSFNTAESQYRLNLCEDLIREAQLHKIDEIQDWIEFYEARLLHSRDNWKLAQEKLETLLKKVLLSEELKRYIQAWLGRIYYRVGELGKAERMYLAALKAYEDSSQKALQAPILLQLGDIKMGQRKWTQAKKYIEKCFRIYEDVEKENLVFNKSNQPQMLNDQIMGEYENAIFVSYARGGESERTVEELEQDFAKYSIRIVRDKKDLGYKGSIEEFEQRIGQGQYVILVISDKYLRSIHCMNEFVEISQNQKTDKRIFPIVLSDAKIYDPVDRLAFIRYWEDKIKKLDDEIKKINVVSNLGGITAELDRYTRIRAHIDSLLDLLSDMNTLTPEIHKNSGFTTLINAINASMIKGTPSQQSINIATDPMFVDRNKAWAWNSLGTIFLEQGYFESALDLYQKSLEKFQQIGDKYGVARSLYRTGWVLQQTGKWDEAISYYKQSREILTELGANYWIARVIVKLADTYRLTGDLEKSEDIYLECMRICIKLKAPLGIPVVLDSLGKLYQDKDLLVKAENMHLRSINKKRQSDFSFEIELTLMNFGDLELKRNNWKKALEYYDQSIVIMRKSKNHYGESLLLTKVCDALLQSLDTSGEEEKNNAFLKLAEKISKRHKYIDIQSRILFLQVRSSLKSKLKSKIAEFFIKEFE